MRTDEFNYQLPENLIAHSPAGKRDRSRLMVVSKQTSTFSDHYFSDLPHLLKPGDVLVMNDTKVIKARLVGKRSSGGKTEVFLLEPLAGLRWKVLLKPAKRLKPDEVIHFGEGFSCHVVEKYVDGECHVVAFSTEDHFFDMVDRYGQMPLPPYIKPSMMTEELEKRYQTVMANTPGAVAAPTAGLHFTTDMIKTLQTMGITVLTITLHVGYGTFKPISSETVEDHQLHAERFNVSEETSIILTKALQTGRRIIAVGTTVTRTLESCWQGGAIQPGAGSTSLYIYPGYQFKVISGLITNFHLPKSSLLVLVSAFAGKDLMTRAYEDAVRKQYRFFSFGDAMAIL